MKILYHHRVASKDGQYVHIAEILNSLRKLGHEVIVCEPSSIQNTEFGQGSGVVDNIRAHLPGFIHELAEFLYSISDYWKIRSLIKKHRPDVIYERYNLFFVSGIWASKRFQLPILMEVNAPLYQERAKNDSISLHWLARWSEGYAWKNADAVLPVTAVLADMVVERGVAAERIKVIPNGINSQFADNLPSVDSINDQYDLSDKLVLGFTGFVREWHRLDRVLNSIAANLDSNRHLLLVGDGPDRPRLERLAKQLKISHRFTVTGIVGRDQMPEMVQRFDIALQPDVVAYASPLKMFEYMALGKPILAPDMDNIREILVEGENALLFAPTDESFNTQLARLCSEPELRQQLGSAARATIDTKRLRWDDNAADIVALFNTLL